jgi:hypothetical protein
MNKIEKRELREKVRSSSQYPKSQHDSQNGFVDLHYLLSSSEGQQHLQNGSNVFGVHVTSNSPKFACVDFGITSITNWIVTDVPKGYEELRDSTESFVYMDQIMTVLNSSVDPLSISLNDIEVLPRMGKDYPYFSLLEMDNDDELELGIKIRQGCSIQFRLRCVIPGSAFVGSLNRWLILSFSKNHKRSPTCVQRYEFVSGLKVIGCVLSEGIKNKMLSSEAQPFIPISALTYFDSPTLSIMVVKGEVPYQRVS